MRPIRTRAALLSLCLLAASAACEVSSEGPRDRAQAAGDMLPNEEIDSIARAMRDSVTTIIATGAQAATLMPALYTPDAVFSDESEQTHAGHDAIARAFAQGVPPGSSIDIRSQSVIGSGDLVVDMGSYTFRMPGAQGTPVEMRGRYLVALQRMDDGSWKIVRQLTDAVGMGGAIAPTPPPAAADTATPDSPRAARTPAAPARSETGFTPSP